MQQISLFDGAEEPLEILVKCGLCGKQWVENGLKARYGEQHRCPTKRQSKKGGSESTRKRAPKTTAISAVIIRFVNGRKVRFHQNATGKYAPCSSRCWNAISSDCSCQCGGFNHGRGR